MDSFFNRLYHRSILSFVSVALIALALCSLVSCVTKSDANTGASKNNEIRRATDIGDFKKVKALLQDNPDLVFSKGNEDGTTPLHLAVIGGHKDLVELLFANKADINAKDKAGWTPLHFAVYKGHKDIVELLLANKAEVNITNNAGDTPLLLAALFGNKDVVELLLANKAEVNARNNKGETPLHYAARRMGHNYVVELLRQHGGEE